jgi:hypothetical protein
MSGAQEATTVRHEVVVEAPVEQAFAVFVNDIDKFKPREHNMLAVEIAEAVFEPRAPAAAPATRSTSAPCSPSNRRRAAHACRWLCRTPCC